MPKVSVYLPDPLYDAVRRHDISVSVVAQGALEAEVRRLANADWINKVRRRPRRVAEPIDTSALLGAVRDEFGE
jgi:post-segregation antitoxin (ccd killing protein)